MMMPSIFGENLFDDFFDNSFRDYSGTQELMKTDVKENENDFEIDMSLPGEKEICPQRTLLWIMQQKLLCRRSG